MTDSEKQRALELALSITDPNRSSAIPADAAMTLARAVLLNQQDMNQMRRHVAHNDEEYQTMKDVLRAEHEACKQLRVDLERCRAVCEAAVAWRSAMDFAASRAPGEIFTCEQHLADAIDALDRGARGEGVAWGFDVSLRGPQAEAIRELKKSRTT